MSPNSGSPDSGNEKPGPLDVGQNTKRDAIPDAGVECRTVLIGELKEPLNSLGFCCWKREEAQAHTPSKTHKRLLKSMFETGTRTCDFRMACYNYASQKRRRSLWILNR